MMQGLIQCCLRGSGGPSCQDRLYLPLLGSSGFKQILQRKKTMSMPCLEGSPSRLAYFLNRPLFRISHSDLLQLRENYLCKLKIDFKI